MHCMFTIMNTTAQFGTEIKNATNMKLRENAAGNAQRDVDIRQLTPILMGNVTSAECRIWTQSNYST